MATEWRLDDLRIESDKNYRTGEITYQGRIRFQNSNWESFSFRLNEEEQAAYLALIAKQVVKSAEDLGKRVAESLRGVDDADTQS